MTAGNSMLSNVEELQRCSVKRIYTCMLFLLKEIIRSWLIWGYPTPRLPRVRVRFGLGLGFRVRFGLGLGLGLG